MIIQTKWTDFDEIYQFDLFEFTFKISAPLAAKKW
jgi:hypothetical protein